MGKGHSDHVDRHNRAMNGIYWNQHALRVIFQYLGAPGFPGLEPGLKKLVHSGNLYQALLKVHPEGIVVTGPQVPHHPIAGERYELRFPCVLARDFGVPNAWKTIYHHSIGEENPPIELNMQLWQRDTHCLAHPLDTEYKGDMNQARPTRAIFVVDVEYKNKLDENKVIVNQERVFNEVQDVVKCIEKVLHQYDISYLKVMTGKGYNLVGHVPEFEQAFEEVCKISSPLEDSLLFFMSHIDRRNRRIHQVPRSMELAHKGLGRIMQYVTNLGWQLYRQKGGKARVTSKSTGPRGQVIIDQYHLAVEASMKGTGIPGCPYLRFWYQDWKQDFDFLKHRVLPNTCIPIRLPLGHPGVDNLSISDAVRVRNNFWSAMEYLSGTTGAIPNCSKGIMKVLHDYRKSELGKLHQRMDQKPTISFDIERQARELPGNLSRMIKQADPVLCTGEGLGTFVSALYNTKWHPKDIASLIASGYARCNPPWTHYYSLHRRANGETERVIGEIVMGLK